MRRLAAVDWLLIGTLLPISLFGVVMTVLYGVRHPSLGLPLVVSSAPSDESYPVVRSFNASPGFETDSLAVGDRLLRLKEIDLRGLSAAGFILRLPEVEWTTDRSLPLTIERDGVRAEVRVPLLPFVPWWVPLPFVLSLAAIALLLLVRGAHWYLARRFYVASLLFAIFATPYFGNPFAAPRLMITLWVVVVPLAYGLTIWNALESPASALSLRPWQRVVPLALTLLASASRVAGFWLPDAGLGAVLMRSSGLAGIAFVIAVLGALTRGYRRSDPLGRRQVKWVVYGFYLGTLPYAVFVATSWLGVIPDWTNTIFFAATIAAVAIPLGFLVAIAFYQFLDIDRLFSATLTYSLLAILGIATVLGLLPSASRTASETLGLAPESGQILLSLGLAAIFVPAQRIMRPRIDRLLFAERFALQQGFERLLTEIGNSADTQELTRLVGERFDALLRPASAVLYGRAGDVFTPMAVRGRTAPPAFAAQSALIAALQERTTPLVAQRWTARRTTSLTPFERAALETLDTAVLLPIRRGADLVAFSCLGPKRSGDIYTPTDLTLLGAVAGKISDRLLALDATAVTEQARNMQEALRRYVPGAVAERIVSGRSVEAGEREVTVLFVDIRGYTGFSESRQAEEIFATVNRYTETVSQLVQARGGVVVEFHGDGMLAVFGAPDEIPMKERAAVQAGRDILAGIAALSGPGGAAAPALSVGVGIATGPAFVGNIQSSDRFIWTVIGNTTNLAARLQSLTRDLDAAVAVDDTTFRRAGPACADFLRHGDLPIRGRSQPETVHALPLHQPERHHR